MNVPQVNRVGRRLQYVFGSCMSRQKLNFSFEIGNSIELSLLINVNDIDMIPLLVVPLFKDIFIKVDQAF